MSQKEAAERAREAALRAQREKPLNPMLLRAPAVIAGLLLVIMGVLLTLQITGEDAHRDDVTGQVTELENQADTAEKNLRDKQAQLVTAVAGTDLVRYDRDAVALQEWIVGGDVDLKIHGDVDQELMDQVAQLHESETASAQEGNEVEIVTIITGIDEGTLAEPGDQHYRTTMTLPQTGKEVIVTTTFDADGTLTSFSAEAYEIITEKEG